MSRPVSIPVLLEGWVENVPAIAVEGLCADADRIEPGQAYVHMGTGCPRAAEARGARIVIHGDRERVEGLGIPCVALSELDTRFPSLAARFHRHPADQLKIAAVAGSGSPVAHYIAQSWQRVNGAAGVVGESGSGLFRQLNRKAAAPVDALALHRVLGGCLDGGAEMVAMNTTPHQLQQGWLEEVAVDVAVHTGSDPDRDEDLRPLFSTCQPRFAVVNHDRAEGKSLTRLAGGGVQVLTYGTNGATELQGSILGMDSGGMTLSLASPWGGGQLRTGLMGRENLDYLLASAGTMALLGMPWNRVMHQLEIMSAMPGQMSCVGGEPGQPTAVIDSARTPAALENVLVSLRSHLHGRLHCVIETGGLKRRQMVSVAESFADRVFQASASTRSEAIRRAIRASGRGDIVLIAGAWKAGETGGGEAEVRNLLEEAA